MKREYREIPLSDIILSKDNARKNIEKSPTFPEFVASVKAGGIRQPLLVREHPDKKGKFELRAGERRYRGAKVAGLNIVPVIIHTGLTDLDALDLTYIENKFRDNLKPLEEAAEVALLLERCGGDAKAVAQRIGKDRQWVYIRANIAKGLIKPWRSYIESEAGQKIAKNWSLSHLSLIARLPEHIQQNILEYVEDDPWEYETMSAADLEDEINKTLHLLSKAKWSLDDETLLPKAGACSKCPKRSGHQPMLWFDSDDQVDAGDQCLDGFCWQEKDMAWLERKAAEHRANHQDLMLILPDSRGGVDRQAIAEKLGTPLEPYQYKTCSKSTKGAKPAMYVYGKGAGKLTYIKVSEFTSARSAGKPKGVPTPLKQRRQTLDAKRWAQVLIDLREKVKEAAVADITYQDKIGSIMALAAAHGNKKLLNYWGLRYSEDKPKTSEGEIAELVKSKDCQARAIELLWQSFLPTLDDLLTYNGPITQTPKKYKDDATWIAEMIGIDIKVMFKDVSKRKGFMVPKSWSNLNEDGTPKKAKSSKKKKAKKSKGKKSKKAELKKTVEKSESLEIKRKCRICGCTDDNACIDEKTGEPCHWVEDDLCSNCHESLIINKKVG